jgi:hypothetical protein
VATTKDCTCGFLRSLGKPTGWMPAQLTPRRLVHYADVTWWVAATMLADSVM